MFTKLQDATADQIDKLTADFTAADWCDLMTRHLDVASLDLLVHLEQLGVDMDDDPVAVFCRLYLAARAADFFPHCHPDDNHHSEVVAVLPRYECGG